MTLLPRRTTPGSETISVLPDPSPHAAFEAWDTNGDGVPSRDEIEVNLRAFVGGKDMATSAVARKILKEIDGDGVGRSV